MRRFWAIRRIDRDYVEPTLYKSEAAARSAAASRRGYDVLELISEAEARSVSLPADPNDPFVTALEIVLRTDEICADSGLHGLADCYDNIGRPYQSATLASALRIIRRRVIPTPPKAEGEQ